METNVEKETNYNGRGAEFATPNTHIWHKDCLGVIIFKEQQTQDELWKQSRSFPLLREFYKGNLHL